MIAIVGCRSPTSAPTVEVLPLVGSEPAFSPDGTQIACSADYSEGGEVVQCIATSRRPFERMRPLARMHRYCANAEWTPDGLGLLHHTGANLLRTDIRTGTTKLLARLPVPARGIFRLARDGRKVAYCVVTKPKEPLRSDPRNLVIGNLAVYDLAARKLTMVTNFSDPWLRASSGLGLTWSADGKRIVFGVVRLGPGNELWLADLTAMSTSPLVTAEDAKAPAISPDGRSLAYYTLRRHRIVVRDLASLRKIEVPADVWYGSLSWSPAGDALLYTKCDIRAEGLDNWHLAIMAWVTPPQLALPVNQDVRRE